MGVPDGDVHGAEGRDGDTGVSRWVAVVPDGLPDALGVPGRTADDEVSEVSYDHVEGTQTAAVDREGVTLADHAIRRLDVDQDATSGTDVMDGRSDRPVQGHIDDGGRQTADPRHRRVEVRGSGDLQVRRYWRYDGSIRSSIRFRAGHSCFPSGKRSYWCLARSQISDGPGSISRPVACARSSVRQPRTK